MTDPTLPPIMQTPGLRLVAIGMTEDGRAYLKFITNRRKTADVIVLITDNPTTIVYGYTMYDADTHTSQRYLGPYGDPTRDRPDPDGPWGVPT